MKIEYGKILLYALAPLIGKFVLYRLIFYLRKIDIQNLQCLTIAGASVLLSVIPLPLPEALYVVAIIGISAILIQRYTEAELYPDGLFIPFGVELFYAYGLIPLLSKL
ncbi:MAG: hypothetical protein V1799_02180 [bacterium]